MVPAKEFSPGAVLGGSYRGANFSGAEIESATLSGDFAAVNFRGAELRRCILAGNFDGAHALGAALHFCKVAPSACFRSSDLRGAHLLLCHPDQVRNAVFESTDPIDVLLGKTIQVHGRIYELCVPAQVLKDVVLTDAPGGSPNSTDRRFELLRLSSPFVQSGLREDKDLLHDVSGCESDLVWPHETTKAYECLQRHVNSLHFHLNAPGARLKNLRPSLRDLSVKLTGNFEGAVFSECSLLTLELKAGSFKRTDLSGAAVRRVVLNMDEVNIDGLFLPKEFEEVSFVWRVNGRAIAFAAEVSYASHILKAWYSANDCEAIARHVINAEQSKWQFNGARMLRSIGLTIPGVLRNSMPKALLVLAAAMIVRRNQLQNSGRRNTGSSHRAPRTQGGSAVSVTKGDSRNGENDTDAEAA